VTNYLSGKDLAIISMQLKLPSSDQAKFRINLQLQYWKVTKHGEVIFPITPLAMSVLRDFWLLDEANSDFSNCFCNGFYGTNQHISKSCERASGRDIHI